MFTMEDSTRILVIFLSCALAVFLILGVFVLIKVLQILIYIKQISEKAVNLADKAEAVGEFFEKSATPLAVAKLIAKTVDGFLGRKRRKSKRRSDYDE